MVTTTLTLRIRFPWWWHCIYWPLTRFGAWLGLPINPDVVAADAMKAAKIEVARDART